MWVVWLVRPDMKTRWFLPLEIHDSQLCSPIDLHDLRYLPRPGKRNANSAVANVDMREIIYSLKHLAYSQEENSFCRYLVYTFSNSHIISDLYVAIFDCSIVR